MAKGSVVQMSQSRTRLLVENMSAARVDANGSRRSSNASLMASAAVGIGTDCVYASHAVVIDHFSGHGHLEEHTHMIASAIHSMIISTLIARGIPTMGVPV